MIFSSPHLQDGARWAGMRVGILGGSFNPPHEGHIHASLVALTSLRLDCIWWLVSPQNPLKNPSSAQFQERYTACQDFVRSPRIIVSDLEYQMNCNLSWKTVRNLKLYFPLTDFVFITGMDNALTMHKWHNWQDILSHMATAHVARPPACTLIENCPLKLLATQNHSYIDKAIRAPLLPHDTYWLLQKKLLSISSTEIRNHTNITSG